MKGGVLVTHPGRQHSHQLARALHQSEILEGYWTGVPAADPSTKGLLYRMGIQYSPQPDVGLSDSRVDHNYIMPITRRIAERVLPTSIAVSIRHRAAAWFDGWVAQRLPASTNAVVAYENAARETFQAAQKNGITTILDAASFHYEWQDAFYDPVESEAAHRRINRRKKAEVQLADHILTVSELARESYIDAGVDPCRVTSVPMGVDLQDFAAGGTGESQREPFTFIFAGHAGRRKGVDVLLSASEHLSKDCNLDCQIQFAGGREDELFSATSAPVTNLGYLDRAELAEAFRRADCLVLPSRHDSFGRVVVEAMATGLPVIVSNHVGAKEAIEEGETGWVVPAGDVKALAEQMRWCIDHPTAVAEMAPAASEAAQAYSWKAYHRRVRDIIREVMSETQQA